jgi:hypothetical protein
MAFPIVDVNAITTAYIAPKATEVVYKNSPTFTRLHTRRMERFEGGNQIQRVLTVGKLWGDAVGRGSAFDIDYVVTETALQLQMKLYAVNMTLYGFDAMLNNGDPAVFSQIELKFKNAGLRMAELLGTALFLSSQDPGRSLNLEGLNAWVDDGNLYPTIGGITRADVMAIGQPGGLNSYVANLTSFNLAAVQNAYTQSAWGADHVDLITATPNGWNLFWNSLQPLQRYPDMTNTDVGKMGFQAFRFNAAEVVMDRYAPTGTAGAMWLLNTEYVEWYFSTVPLFQWGFTGFKEAANSIDYAGQYLVGTQFLLPNPRSCAKLTCTAGTLF